MRLTSLRTAALVLVLAGAALASEVTLSYTLSIEKPDTGVGHVSATISGLSGDGVRLLRPAMAGQGWFDEVRARDSAGKALAVGPTDGGYYITTGGEARITVTYAIKPGTIGAFGHFGLICGDYAALDGSEIFLVPSQDNNIERAELRFSGPSDWRAVTAWMKTEGSWQADPDYAPISTQLERSLFCFGNFRRISKGFGGNTLSVFALESYPEADRAKLAEAVQNVYGSIYDVLQIETGREYNVVALPIGPDAVPVVAGAWSDGLAMTLAGRFAKSELSRNVETCGRLIMSSLFAEVPYGVKLADEDWWFYPAVMRYGECLAVESLGLNDENTFYSIIYNDYVAEASADNTVVDIPIAQSGSALPQAFAFLRRTKAPLLLMRLDFQLRETTDDAVNIGTLIRYLLQRQDRDAPVRLLDAIADLTNKNFQEFYDRFIDAASFILPTWPSFIAAIKKQAKEGPGPVAATVDGVPIYESEVALLSSASTQKTPVMGPAQMHRAALAVLVDEKLMDKALAKRRVQVVPEVFWQLRGNLPPRVMRLIITKKRQVLKDILFDEWKDQEKNDTEIELTTSSQEASPAAAQPQR